MKRRKFALNEQEWSMYFFATNTILDSAQNEWFYYDVYFCFYFFRVQIFS